MNIKAYKIILTVMSAVVFSTVTKSYAFYGRHTAQTVLTFESRIEVSIKGLNDVNQLKTGAMRAKALEYVDLQLQHLMGTFQSASFKEELGAPGSLGLIDTNGVTFLNVEPVDSGKASRKLITYSYSGDALFEKDLFSGVGDSITVPIKLPLVVDPKDTPTDAKRIYNISFNAKKNSNPCTDHHYNTEGDFWYFWDPDQEGCNLKGDSVNVVRISGTATRVDRSYETYPEYNKLFKSQYNGGALDISVFLGYIDEEKIDGVKPNKKDAGYFAMTKLMAEYEGRGFTLVDQKDAFSMSQGTAIEEGINYERTYEKTVVPESGYGFKPTIVRIKILLADTSIGSPDETFRRSLRKAVKESEIVIYDGHSGLGANLDVSSIPNLKMNKEKYQIFFLNGCSSYTYFNYMYTEAKGGTKNLDILSAGLPTMTDVTASNIIAFLNYIVEGKLRGYEKTIQNIDASNGAYNGTFLVSVSGDEDNKWKPKSK